MHKYKTMKSDGNWSVRKQKVVDSPAISEIKKGDDFIRHAVAEKSHEELQVVKKCFDADTGEALEDSVEVYSLIRVSNEIDRCKAEVVKIEAEKAEWEQLETDLKAL